jgi:Holliday junction resolvase RusA-like endonuclease
MKFTVPGEPTGKARPRVGNRPGFTQTYTPEKTATYENLVRLEFQHAANAQGYMPILEGPVRVRIDAYYSVPKSTSRKRWREMLAGWVHPTKKPDWDNIGKIVCDALNGIAYRDDSQVVDGRVLKHFADIPRVEVQIEEVPKYEGLFDHIL